MHFAQTLDAGEVPEWRSRYVDYNYGKKLIKRLSSGAPSSRRRFSISGAVSSARLGSAPRQEPPNAAQSIRSLSLPSPALPVYRGAIPSGSDSITGVIPPPARVSGSKRAAESSGIEEPSAPSPLYARNTPNTPRVTTNLVDRLVASGRTTPRTPRTPRTAETRGASHTPVSETIDLRQRDRERHSESAATPGRAKIQQPSQLSSTPNEDEDEEEEEGEQEEINDRSPLLTSDTPQSYGSVKNGQINAFYEWLNEEVSRVELFYSSQIADADSKIHILKTQLKHLEEHHYQRQKSNSRIPTADTFFDRLDLPTMPNSFRRHERGDYQREHVGYTQAKVMLRTAMVENYRDLQQLADFRLLNLTAIRKITKKFDKTIGVSTMTKYFQRIQKEELKITQEHIGDLIHQCEDLYARYLEGGNHKHAVERLSVGRNANSAPHSPTVILTGWLLGAAVPLLVRAIYAGVTRLNSSEGLQYEEVRTLLQIWGGFSLVGVMFLGMAANTVLWSFFRINYPFIFEFDRSDCLDLAQTGLMPAIYTFVGSLFAWLTFEPTGNIYRYMPCIFVGLFAVALAVPFGLYWPARRWLLHSLFRLVFSSLYSVEFRDFFLGDLMCSLNYSISNLAFFFCIYATPNWWRSPRSQRCSSTHSRVVGFLNCLPAVWRLLQCLRRFSDTLDWFPHLLNAGKYTSVMMYNMTLSLARIGPPNSVKFRAVFTVFAAINGIYTALWDVYMDFSLSPPQLRQITVYRRWYYYFVMIVDPIMRQSWLLYAVYWSEKPQSAKISYIVSLIETCRRLLWASVRVENEHSANIARCRAFKDLSLPYEDLQLAAERELQLVDHATQEESHVSSSTINETASLPITAMPRLQRAFTYAASPRLAALSVAHTSDFERRRQNEASDEDDEDEDEDGA